MLAANRFAFKEWAAVCHGLAAGEQHLILRKGGIHEGRAGFRVEHPEFWLFPTAFHQAETDLSAPGQRWLQAVRQDLPRPDVVRVRHYAIVQQVVEFEDLAVLPRLEGLHGWSSQTINDRFHYRRPGLFALVVRIYERATAFEMPDSPHFGGCRSWVDFPTDLPTDGLLPVVSDEEAVRQFERLARALTSTAIG